MEGNWKGLEIRLELWFLRGTSNSSVLNASGPDQKSSEIKVVLANVKKVLLNSFNSSYIYI